MSLSEGNRYFKEGKIEEAIKEYKKILPNSPLYDIAKFNLMLIEKKFYKKYNIEEKNDKEIGTNYNNMPLVSIIMPVFNVAPYLDASILSVINQTYKNIELIIVNDASTDNSLNIINMYKKQDERIKVINLEYNTLGGAGIPSNIGVDSAKGEYIAYADSDDILDKNAILKMMDIALVTDSEVVIADFVTFNDDTREVFTAYDKKNWSGLPFGKIINPTEYPQLFRLSPVPWRKLYKRGFLNKNKIFFPEGDYFYEDNPLHWFVLSKAKKVTLLDYVVAYHRMDREGQTMGANNYKLLAMFNHVNTIRKYFVENKIISDILWKELVDYSYRCGWVIDKQEKLDIKNIAKKRYSIVASNVVKDSNLDMSEIIKIRPSYKKKLDDYSKSYPDKDLCIILPIYNCEEFLEELLQKISQISLNIEVFMMDDGSTDNSVEIVEKFTKKYKNFYLFTQSNKGAGIARNAMIPLITAKYTYFMDADDILDINNLIDAYNYASKNKYDLLFFKYKIHFYEQNKFRDMWIADKNNFDMLLRAKTNNDKKIAASSLVNYPWNRLIKTSLLHDENIFFGKTIVHNDIPFHWHSIISAKNIGALDKEVCYHRKFDTKKQITNISDHRRMMVLEAYRYTHRVIKRYNDYKIIFPIWKKFIEHILEWAKDKVPKELLVDYTAKQQTILKELKETLI